MPVPPRGEEKGGNGPFSDKLSSPNRPNRQNPMTFYFLPAKGRKWVLFGGGTGMSEPLAPWVRDWQWLPVAASAASLPAVSTEPAVPVRSASLSDRSDY